MAQKKSGASTKKKFSWSNLSTREKIPLIVALIGFTGAIVAALIKYLPDMVKSKPPEFKLVKGVVYHPDSTIIIRAINNSARKEQPIIFEIDGYCFHEAAEVITQQDNFLWQLQVKKFGLPEKVLSDGEHQVSFGFSQNNMSQPQKIYFDSKSPQTFVRLEGESTTEKRIYGQVVDESPAPDQNISVEVAFQHQERLKTTQIPVKSYVDSTGRKMFEFEYQVQNIPQIPKDDPKYHQPFFAIKITDEAGNEFHHSATYGRFIAEGIETFGTKSAEILFQKIDDEKIPVGKLTTQSQKKEPKPKMIDAGEPLITLRVLIRTPNYVQLSWNRLPEKLRGARDEYVVLRQNQKIATAFDTTYTDGSIKLDSTYQYQVLAKGREEKYYPSNIISTIPPAPPLRSVPASLTKDQVQLMLTNKKFFDADWNKEGQGYPNQFEVRSIKGDKVIIDHSSNLIWQQGGSESSMNFEAAKQWINSLNQKGYAGFKDWRLPTLEEAMSLMEPKKNKNDLYIDPIFDATQPWIWTCDLVPGESRVAVSAAPLCACGSFQTIIPGMI